MRSFLAELLEEEGFDVTTASNGFSALRLLSERRPRLVLLDVLMPELSGSDVLQELRTSPHTRETAVVFVSGNLSRLSDAQLAAADGIVEKPFEVPDLLATVHRAVQHASSRRSEVAPLAAGLHHESPVRPLRATARRTRGRR